MWLLHSPHVKYKITYREKIGHWTLLDVTFEGCPNGRKFLLYYKEVPDVIEPHFGYSNSPMARFKPTAIGWHTALAFMVGDK